MGSAVLAPPGTKGPARGRGSGGGDGSPGGGRRGGDQNPRDLPAQAYRTGIWMALAAIAMFFATLTSAMVVRKGLSNDWRPISPPGVLWLNTFLLLLSSATLERSRRLMFRQPGRFAFWWLATLGLGLVFIAGQLVAWRELASQGVFLATNPSSSFFYLLTASHGVHLAGGMCALTYLNIRRRRRPLTRTVVDVTAIYWHCMDGLWVYLFLLLSAARWI